MNLRVLSLASFCAAAACVGAIPGGDPGDPGAPPPAASMPPAPAPAGTTGAMGPGPAPAAAAAGATALRRLSRDEYGNTVADLLGAAATTGNLLPADPTGPNGFAAATPVGAPEARALMSAAESAADAAVANLKALLPCDPAATGEDRCAAQFIARFARRAYRRAPTAAEVAALQAMYTQARTADGYGFADALRRVIVAALQSPSFVYRWDTPDGKPDPRTGQVKLTADAVATRLSYLLYASMPDDGLFAAADAGGLATPQGVAAQAQRMLADPRAARGLARFHLQWLDLAGVADVQKDPAVYPQWGRPLGNAMALDVDLFARYVFQSADGKLETLLAAPVAFVSSSLSWVYNVKDPAGDAPERRDLDPAQRAGLLTSAAFLTRHGNTYESHPVRRGKAVFERVLCGEIPPPPPNVPQIKPPAPNLSTRERYTQHSTDPVCAACHHIMDPIGFAFENYDGLGAWRTSDANKPIDASGTLTYPRAGATAPFKNAVDLAKQLARSDDARRCMAVTWARYALGRREDAADAATIDELSAAFAAGGWDLRALVVALARSAAVTSRRPTAGEVF